MRTTQRAAPTEVRRRDNGTVTLTRRYRLITPLFGGGVEARTADPVTLIRGSSVRGQLRFWWRATRGGLFGGSLERMRAREGEIWGAAAVAGGAGPSKVSVLVTVTERGKDAQPYSFRPGRNFPDNDASVAPGYAAFPIQPNNNDRSLKPVREGVAFTLDLRFPRDLEPDVRAALWAWETFGGIGARTRRGFGALALAEEAERPATLGQAREHVQAGLKRHVAAGPWPNGTPHLDRDTALRVVNSDWQGLIQALRSFRQWREQDNPDLPKHERSARDPKQSLWPEPDTLRRLKRTNSFGHAAKHPVQKFPRAVFGLPIVFKFKDDNRGDPSVSILRHEATDRLASPLILRPLALVKGTVGVAVLLSGNLGVIDSLCIEGVPGPIRADVSEGEARAIPALKGGTNVLAAFLDFLEEDR